MASFDTRPKVVDIDHYGGDTLTIRVNATEEIVDGREWMAQVRDKPRGGRVLKSFVVTEDVDGAFLQLPAADCAELTERGKFKGFWDVQLAVPVDVDPTVTLARGYLNIDTDVTQP